MRKLSLLLVSLSVLAMPAIAVAAEIHWDIIIPMITLARPMFGLPCDRCIPASVYSNDTPYVEYVSYSRQMRTVRAAAAGQVSDITSSVDGESGTIVVQGIGGYSVAYSFTGTPVIHMGDRIRKGALIGTMAYEKDGSIVQVSVTQKDQPMDMEKLR